MATVAFESREDPPMDEIFETPAHATTVEAVNLMGSNYVLSLDLDRCRGSQSELPPIEKDDNWPGSF